MQCLNLRHVDFGKFIVVFKYMIDLHKAHGEDVASGVFCLELAGSGNGEAKSIVKINSAF